LDRTLVFYLSYLRNELLRRRARTILTVLGLAVGVGLVIAITSLSRGLDQAQKTALNPLSSIGTDLTVTRAVDVQRGGFQGGGPGGGGGFGGGGAIIQANQSVLTDLSKLGKPGQHFVHDFFLPGTQLTFPASQTAQIAKLSGVAEVSSGLMLLAEHQEGTVPKIVATFKSGGQRLNVSGRLSPPTQAELATMQACFAKVRAAQGGSGNTTPGGGGGAAGGGGFSQGGGGNGRPRDFGAFSKCLPARLRQFRRTITTPQQTLKQVLAPPQTNIKSSAYAIGGVDQTKPDIGLVTPAQVTSGRYFSTAGGREALVGTSYAANHKLKVGSTITLNGTTFTVVGLVQPPLGGQTADVYLPLKQLQTLAHEPGLANVALVRATNSSSVGTVQREITQNLGGASVASAKQVADRISGSLVDASNLAHNLGLVIAIVVAGAAFLLAIVLTLSSVGKRVRELGTLKALGWSQRLVVRQVVAESLTQGIIGGLVGIVIGVVATAGIRAWGPTLTAHSASSGTSLFGLGSVASRAASRAVALHTPISIELIVFGLLLAIVGGLIAGAAGALRAARLRPADALRTVE
jgi:putative ABC transport system permease protein